MGSAFHQLCPRYSGTLTPLPPRLLDYAKPLILLSFLFGVFLHLNGSVFSNLYFGGLDLIFKVSGGLRCQITVTGTFMKKE